MISPLAHRSTASRSISGTESDQQASGHDRDHRQPRQLAEISDLIAVCFLAGATHLQILIPMAPARAICSGAELCRAAR
jgi:hypothetical protein